MRRALIALLATSWLALSADALPTAAAQNLLSVGFHNETPVPIIIQGTTIINGIPRRGAPLVIPVGRGAFDLNVPHGIRFYTIINANQPAMVLLRDFAVPLQGGNVVFVVRPSAQNPAQVELHLP